MPLKVHIDLHRTIDTSYDIEIGSPLQTLGRKIKGEYPESKTFIITDSHVGKLYANLLIDSFPGRARDITVITISAGEQSKTRAIKEQVENKFFSLGADRHSLIIALGGGVIGDLAGFVAATYMRGIPYIQIPTSLLAQVDSSIGGKVAVDHPLGKNMIGAFHQPSHVYIDPNVLTTLPDREYLNGLAEVIKYGAILDGAFFNYLERYRSAILRRDPKTLRVIIKRCCELKGDIVQKDETETGLRRVLNFGHTIGHAIERHSDYAIPHGEAVAIGMVVEARISVNAGLLSQNSLHRLQKLISSYNLPVAFLPPAELRRLISLTAADKKSRGGKVAYTLLQNIGVAKAGVLLTQEQVKTLLSR